MATLPPGAPGPTPATPGRRARAATRAISAGSYVRNHPVRAAAWTLAGVAGLYALGIAARTPVDERELLNSRLNYQGVSVPVEYRHVSGGGLRGTNFLQQERGILKEYTPGGATPKYEFIDDHDVTKGPNAQTLDEFIYDDGTGTGVERFKRLGPNKFQYTDKLGRVYESPNHDPVMAAIMQEAERDFKAGEQRYTGLLAVVAAEVKRTIGVGIP